MFFRISWICHVLFMQIFPVWRFLNVKPLLTIYLFLTFICINILHFPRAPFDLAWTFETASVVSYTVCMPIMQKHSTSVLWREDQHNDDIPRKFTLINKLKDVGDNICGNFAIPENKFNTNYFTHIRTLTDTIPVKISQNHIL